MVGFPELNKISITETDTEYAVYYSSNSMSGHFYNILLSIGQVIALFFLGWWQTSIFFIAKSCETNTNTFMCLNDIYIDLDHFFNFKYLAVHGAWWFEFFSLKSLTKLAFLGVKTVAFLFYFLVLKNVASIFKFGYESE